MSSIVKHTNVKVVAEKASSGHETHFLQLNDQLELKVSDDDLLTQLTSIDGNIVDIETILNSHTTKLETLATSAIQINGTAQAKCMGIGDDGANKQIKTDNSGNISAFLVSDAVMKPSNITNGDHASFSGSSVASMLRCRTNINDNTTGVFLLCDSEGFLSVDNKTDTIKDVEWLSGATISDQALSDVLDTEGYERVFIYGENGGSISGSSLRVFGSNASAGTYYSVGTLAVVTSDSGRYLIREDSPLHDGPSPRYLKIFNSSGTTQTITKLRAVMSHKLRYV